MTIDTARLLAQYNAHANAQMNKVLSTLSPEEWDRDYGGYFSSFRALTGHLYTADVHWLVRFRGHRPFQAVQGSPFDFPPSWAEPPFRTLDEYLSLRASLDASLTAFVGELTNEDLACELAFRNSRGEDHRMNFGGLVIHVFNHQTHHRGQIAQLLDQLKKANDYSNVMALL